MPYLVRQILARDHGRPYHLLPVWPSSPCGPGLLTAFLNLAGNGWLSRAPDCLLRSVNALRFLSLHVLPHHRADSPAILLYLTLFSLPPAPSRFPALSHRPICSPPALSSTIALTKIPVWSTHYLLCPLIQALCSSFLINLSFILFP